METEYVEVPLTQGYVAIIDKDDEERVNCFKWSFFPDHHGQRYAIRGVRVNGKWTTQRLHRFLMGNPPCLVDHINGNGLDNRRCNLRLATNSQNLRNAKKKRGSVSRFKGVSRDHKRWRARIWDEKDIHLGCFDSEEEAAAVAEAAARKLHGEFYYEQPIRRDDSGPTSQTPAGLCAPGAAWDGSGGGDLPDMCEPGDDPACQELPEVQPHAPCLDGREIDRREVQGCSV